MIVEWVSLQFLSGPAFLAVYAVLAGLSLLAFLGLENLLRRNLAPQSFAPQLSPAEMAYLRYGERRALAAALLSVESDKPAQDCLEKAILFKTRSGAKPLPVSSGLLRALDEMRADLQKRQWLLPDASRARLAQLLVVLGLLLATVGGVRLLMGLLDHRPVLYLVAEMLAFSVLWIALALRPPGLPRHTRIYLAEQARRHSALAETARSNLKSLTKADAALVLALFGLSTASLPALPRRRRSLAALFSSGSSDREALENEPATGVPEFTSSSGCGG